jgi:hypothetical protein
MSLESRLTAMEKALATCCGDNSRNDHRTIAVLLPEYGPVLLSATKILLEVSPQALARVGSGEAKLASLDDWLSECGPQVFTWPEYWLLRGFLEDLAGGRNEP